MEELVRANEWILSEKQYFGVAGSAYDYNASNPATAKTRYAQLKASQQKLEKRVNMKVCFVLKRL